MSSESGGARGSEAISPTAFYTGWVWARNGLSHPALRTLEGHLQFEAMRPINTVTSTLLGISLESYLLARHRAIDALLARAIEDGRVSQVIEVAAGLSPRGWRFSQRFGDTITYVETDLPGMVRRKRSVLDEIGELSEHHRVVELDALAVDGAVSVSGVAAGLDPARGLAIITEGLLNYLPTDAVLGIWQRFATTLGGFSDGVYLSDLHVRDAQPFYQRAFRVGLSHFVRGQVSLHAGSVAQAADRLHAAGFAAVAIPRAGEIVAGSGRGGEVVHIIEASTSQSQSPSSTTRRVRGATQRAQR